MKKNLTSMKPHLKDLFVLPALMASLGLMLATSAAAQTFTNLHNFTALDPTSSKNSEGANPIAGMILSGNILYGTARDGGSAGNGTLFSLTLPPPLLTITSSGDDIILTWPTNYAGFTLQKAVDLGTGAASVWIVVAQQPVVANGQYVVTLTVTTAQQTFYRLRSP
jgi:uncharacterized repeat protein (TIGR03803 family)